MMILLFAWAVYQIIQYNKFGRRVVNQLVLPFTECISAKNPPKLTLTLHLSNFKNYCYLHISEILSYPDLIVTRTEYTNLYSFKWL